MYQRQIRALSDITPPRETVCTCTFNVCVKVISLGFGVKLRSYLHDAVNGTRMYCEHECCFEKQVESYTTWYGCIVSAYLDDIRPAIAFCSLRIKIVCGRENAPNVFEWQSRAGDHKMY
jgi:hypothetical protein